MCPVIPEIRIEEYSYFLPEARIARYAMAERDSSNLLVYDKGQISHKLFNELPSILSPDLLIAFNDTRVVQARLHFEKHTGSKIEIFCLEPYEPADYHLAFQKQESCIWKCLIGNAKKWKEGTLVKESETGQVRIEASKEGRDKDAFLVELHLYHPTWTGNRELLIKKPTRPFMQGWQALWLPLRQVSILRRRSCRKYPIRA